jgi:hypothetical protein
MAAAASSVQRPALLDAMPRNHNDSHHSPPGEEPGRSPPPLSGPVRRRCPAMHMGIGEEGRGKGEGRRGKPFHGRDKEGKGERWLELHALRSKYMRATPSRSATPQLARVKRSPCTVVVPLSCPRRTRTPSFGPSACRGMSARSRPSSSGRTVTSSSRPRRTSTRRCGARTPARGWVRMRVITVRSGTWT